MTPSPRPRLVCRCLGVTEAQVGEAVRTHQLDCVEDITRYTQAGDGCTACHPLLRRILSRHCSKAGDAALAATSPLPRSAR